MLAIFRDQWRSRPYLLSPVLDLGMAGGGAVLMLLLMVAFIPYEKHTAADVIPVAYIAAGLSWLTFVVNYPHFMVSYQLLYRNFPSRLRGLRGNRELWWRTLGAGLIVPLLLAVMLAYVAVDASRGNAAGINAAYNVMFFFVGWHYTKQAFGVCMMLSALKRIFYAPWQRRMLLVNAYAVWLSSWVYMSYTTQFLGVAFGRGFIGIGGSRFSYHFMEMPDALRIPLLVLACLTTAGAVYAIIAQWRATGVRPSLTALTGYASMYYLWAFMMVLHPEWALAVPFFHGLQYLLFVAAYKRGEIHSRLQAQPAHDARLERRLRNRAQEFFAYAFVLGILAFNIIPGLIDQAAGHAYPGALPANLIPLLFLIFINVHHYFIDNAIWRRENKDVGEFLMGWRRMGKQR